MVGGSDVGAHRRVGGAPAAAGRHGLRSGGGRHRGCAAGAGPGAEGHRRRADGYATRAAVNALKRRLPQANSAYNAADYKLVRVAQLVEDIGFGLAVLDVVSLARSYARDGAVLH